LPFIPNNIKNILIVPDGNLAILPFDMLRENPSSPSILGERFNITLSPSVSVSSVARQTHITKTEPILAFGGAWYDRDESRNDPFLAMSGIDNRFAALDSRLMRLRGGDGEAPSERTRAADHFNQEGNEWSFLAGSLAEIQGLEEIATIPPRIIEGRDVSERLIKRLSIEGALLDYPIIHFALHGFFHENLIPQAALVFSEVSGLLENEVWFLPEGAREDGYLSIEEIALLQLNAKMVMLSACETGLGQIKRGDGMSGLARAFMTAGAQNVGVSLWKIDDDATAEFKWGVYHKVIHEGKTFREAYSEMKAEFRNSTRWSHPFYWAGFTMYE
jgi:CHAT domain-containing protein